jgi:predicted transcriptional regulator of viral defense system
LAKIQTGDGMNIYYEMQKKPIFSLSDAKKYYAHEEAARSALKSLLRNGLAVKIRNNLYTCISGETRAPLANRFQIASAISRTSYVSHHTAMEYYGVGVQVFYEVYVSSETLFNNFEFDGYIYKCVVSKCDKGIEEMEFSGGIRVTDRERTVIDSVKDMEKIAGAEEVFANIMGLTRLNENKMLTYLAHYQNQFLYQKIGFMLEPFQQKFELSNSFFETCVDKAGMSKRYLTKDATGGKYCGKWKLVIPNYLYDEIKGGQNYAVL